MLLDSSYYLPGETLKYSNYPEVYQQMDNINQLQRSVEPIMLAVSNYNQGTTDGIYVNISEVEKARDLAFSISDVLGMADNVCFDILLPVRDTQEALNELIFSYRYESSPVVFDKQRTDMKRLNEVVNKSGGVI